MTPPSQGKTRRSEPERTSDSPNETVERILAAARLIIARDGYDALTLRAINKEAGISNRGVASYYFGNKDGLVEAIVQDIVKMYAQVTLPELPADASLEERVDAFIQAFQNYHLDGTPYLAFFSIFPHVVRDDGLRQHVEGDYEQYYQMVMDYFFPGLDDPRRAALSSVARIIGALDDGFGVQRLIHGDSYDPEPSFEALSMLRERILHVIEE